MTNTVSFPGLGITLTLNRVAFSVFGIDVYYYGLIIAAGLILAAIYTIRVARKEGLKEETILDILLYGIPSAIIFARLYFVIFRWNDYKDNLWNIFNVREGGVAIYGGIIGALLSTLIYCKVKKISFFKVTDICSVGLLIGQAIGRWGNFINQEAFGTNTTLPWGMISESTKSFLTQLQKQGYAVDPNIPVHPTFLYESLWNALGILILIQLRKYQKFKGEMFIAYVIWYGIGRMMIEGLRTDSLMAGPIRVSQLFAFLTALFGILAIVLIRLQINKKKNINNI